MRRTLHAFRAILGRQVEPELRVARRPGVAGHDARVPDGHGSLQIRVEEGVAERDHHLRRRNHRAAGMRRTRLSPGLSDHHCDTEVEELIPGRRRVRRRRTRCAPRVEPTYVPGSDRQADERQLPIRPSFSITGSSHGPYCGSSGTRSSSDVRHRRRADRHASGNTSGVVIGVVTPAAGVVPSPAPSPRTPSPPRAHHPAPPTARRSTGGPPRTPAHPPAPTTTSHAPAPAARIIRRLADVQQERPATRIDEQLQPATHAAGQSRRCNAAVTVRAS